MARRKSRSISASKRRSIPKSKFGLPGSRRYPVDTRARAANAKARATQMYRKGKLSASARAKINAAANRRLKRKG